MYPLVSAAFDRDRAGQAAGLLASLASSSRIFLLGSAPAILQPSGRLCLFPKEPVRAGGILAQASLIRFDDGRPGDRRRCEDLAGAILHSPDALDALPRIDSSLRLPCVVRDGAGLSLPTPGYDAGRRTYFAPAPGLCLNLLPTPAGMDYPHLRELFSGLLYTDPVFHANLIGTLCACFARPACPSFPLIVLDARRQSSGKTSVAQALGILLTGADPSPVTFTGDEKEMSVSLGHCAGEPGPNFIFVDNIRTKRGGSHAVRNQLLAAAFSSHAPCTRALYRGSVPIFEPIICLTMNGARVERDLADKVVRIALTLPPGVIQRRIHPYPPDYAREHRAALLGEILHILERIDLSNLGDHDFRSRFHLFECVALQAAALAGFRPSFDPARVQPPDSLLLELAGIVAADDEAAPGVDVVHTAEASLNVPELREFLRGLPFTAAEARARELLMLVDTAYSAAIITIAGRRGRLAVEGDTLRFILDTAPHDGVE